MGVLPPDFRAPMRHLLPLLLLPAPVLADAALIVHHAKLVPLDPQLSTAYAMRGQEGRSVAGGTAADVLKHKGPKTRVIDAGGKPVLPGLMDSHSHPVGAALSEWKEPLPDPKSLADVFAVIRKKAETTTEGEWIVLR